MSANYYLLADIENNRLKELVNTKKTTDKENYLHFLKIEQYLRTAEVFSRSSVDKTRYPILSDHFNTNELNSFNYPDIERVIVKSPSAFAGKKFSFKRRNPLREVTYSQ